MTVETQQLPKIELLFTPSEVTKLGWDGFGQVVGIMVGIVPTWMWIVFVLILLVFGDKLIPLIARYGFRFVTRSSLLD